MNSATYGHRGNDPVAVGPGVVERALHQRGRQVTATELGVDLGVHEHLVIAAHAVVGEADDAAVDEDLVARLVVVPDDGDGFGSRGGHATRSSTITGISRVVASSYPAKPG